MEFVPSDRCSFCEEAVDRNDPDTYHEVKSWVNGPKLDGPKLREQTGRVAHKRCIELQVAGQAPDQPELFVTEDHAVFREALRCQKQTKDGVCDRALLPDGYCGFWRDHLDNEQ